MLTTSDGGQLVSSMWVDIRNVLVMLLVLVALIGIAYGVFYFVRWRHRNQFTREDKDDDFWNT
jgi:multisubunit Na+/H+ antiporter MnhB subunit